MVLAVEQSRAEVDYLVARDLAPLVLALDRLLDGWNVFARNATADDLVGELHAAAAAERLEDHLDLGELAGAARLLLVRVRMLDLAAERLAEAHARPAHVRLDAELGAHAVDRHLEVQLTHPAEQCLAG